VGSPRALLGLGFEIAVPIVVFMYAGYRMDRWLESSPWWFLVGAFLGVAVGFYSFFRRVLPPRRGPGGERE
jgi:F0F1-type ATP synthase assembly protein I